MAFCLHTEDVVCDNCRRYREPYLAGVATRPQALDPGWLCPACGAGNAPWSPQCPCVGVEKKTEETKP